MERRRHHNLGWISRLLTLALLVMALPSRATWQCLNGMPCTAACRGAQEPAMTPTCHLAAAMPYCAHCQALQDVAMPASPHGRYIATPARCVLRVSARPGAVLTRNTLFTVPMLALPPPAWNYAVSTATVCASFASEIPVFPQRDLRPPSGRAPPSLPV